MSRDEGKLDDAVAHAREALRLQGESGWRTDPDLLKDIISESHRHDE